MLWKCGKVKKFGKTLTNKNCIHEEIKSKYNSGNACCHFVWKLLSSCLLPENINIKICRTRILPVFSHGCETSSFTLREENIRE